MPKQRVVSVRRVAATAVAAVVALTAGGASLRGAAAGGLVAGAPAPAAADVAYAHASEAQRLDLYLPTGVAPHPVVVYLHGGGWHGGDKRADGPLDAVAFLVDAGYAVASVNYRLSTEAAFPAQILDARAAVRWLRSQAATYGLDVDRVAAVGHSAGAHLAALLGTASQAPAFGAPGSAREPSSEVQAVIDLYGPVDLLAADAQLRATSACEDRPERDDLARAVAGLLGGPAVTRRSLATTADPTSHLDPPAAIPPFLIVHGDRDCVVPQESSLALHDAIRTVAGEEASQLVILPGAGHSIALGDPGVRPTVLAFLASALGGPR